MSNLKVVPLFESNFRDPVAALRTLANDIESGRYGDVGCVATVLIGDKVEVFGAGRDSEAPAVALLLHSGFLRMSQAIAEHGRE